MERKREKVRRMEKRGEGEIYRRYRELLIE
jgi:hypothetical protein